METIYLRHKRGFTSFEGTLILLQDLGPDGDIETETRLIEELIIRLKSNILSNVIE